MDITRRKLVQGAMAGSTLLLTPFETQAAPLLRFRFVHLTDLHIQPELGAIDGVALAVRRILRLKPRPNFLLVGGDSIMDALNVSRERAELQFRLLQEAFKPLRMPIHYAIGNHDIYGWTSKDILATDPEYGKKLFAEKTHQSEPYRTFDFKGWRFFILDSVQATKEKGWRAEIDDTQLQWLKDELTKTDVRRPLVFMTHVPLMTLFTQYTTGTTAATPDSLIVRNGKEVRELFKNHNVKAVLQGHTHVVEDCIYTKTHYITSGAICGEWWKGPRLGVHKEGFAVFDVAGSNFKWQYVPYGWRARM